MNKDTLIKELTDFRDNLKEYHETCIKMWQAKINYTDNIIQTLSEDREKPQREKLTEDFGRLEKYFRKLGLSMQAESYGRIYSIFDESLGSTIFNNPAKGEGLPLAIQMATKAIGIAKSLDKIESSKINRTIPNLFISYNFSLENKTVTKKVTDFIKGFDVSIILGSEVDNKSISEKVKEKIDNADLVIVIMTKDEQDSSGNWSPSKWIIEEASYALAKGKEIIRLLEAGNNTDGRIFGDKEYIPFKREDLGDAFIKLAEILNKKIK